MKAILLISNALSGVEKRYVNLFRFAIEEENKDLFLIVNPELAERIQPLFSHAINDRLIVLRGNFYGGSASRAFLSQVALNTEIVYWVKKLGILSMHCVMGGLFCILFAKILFPNLKVIYSESYCSRLTNFPLTKNFIFRYKWFTKIPDRISVLTEEFCRYLQELGISSKRIFVSPCSFIPFVELPVVQKEKLVCFAGRFSFEKNPLLFLKVAKIVQSKNPSISFFALGKGEMNETMTSFIKEMKMENVTIEFKESIGQELNRSSIFCSLQKFTNYPSQSLLEAMFLRNAIVATHFGETNKLVDHSNGFLTSESEQEIAEKILFLFDHPQVHARMMDKSREKVLRKHSVQNYYAYFQSLHSF